MGQTRFSSFVESITNVAIGYGVALLSQIAIFPMFDIRLSIADNLMIGAWFTAISLIRGYVVRRFFNARTSNSR